jgi:flagellum-specific ATP synthase
MEVLLNLLNYMSANINTIPLCENRGSILAVTGLLLEASGPNQPIGSMVKVDAGNNTVPCQIVGFRNDRVLLMALDEVVGISCGAKVRPYTESNMVGISDELLGRIVDGFGNPLDEGRALYCNNLISLYKDPPNPMSRRRINRQFDVGIRVINSLLSVGEGQRVGIMAGSGVGKSTLLGMIARNSQSDINIIALIGERGREVREFIEKDLGVEGLKRSIVVVATSDQPAPLRIRAAYLATAYAEYFRDQGKQVVLMLDSVTRFAMAQREIGLSVGEPPSTKGYTPSVFAQLPRLLERAGLSASTGSITALYTVLVEGDDFNEPISDAVRGILDGHIVLKRELATKGHFPAIDVLDSISRVMIDVTSSENIKKAQELRELLSLYREAEDLISIGAYQSGQNPKLDRAIALREKIIEFLKQDSHQKSTIAEGVATLNKILT